MKFYGATWEPDKFSLTKLKARLSGKLEQTTEESEEQPEGQT